MFLFWVYHAHSFLKACYLFPCFHIFSTGFQKLLVRQVKRLADGQSDFFRLETTDKRDHFMFALSQYHVKRRDHRLRYVVSGA